MKLSFLSFLFSAISIFCLSSYADMLSGSSSYVGTAAGVMPDSVTLATDTEGDYVATITAGAGISTTGASTGEAIAHTLSVDPAFSPTWTGAHTFTPSGTSDTIVEADIDSHFIVRTTTFAPSDLHILGNQIYATNSDANFTFSSQGNLTFYIDLDDDNTDKELLVAKPAIGGPGGQVRLMSVNESGNLFLGADTVAGTGGLGNFLISNGTAPSTAVADLVSLWSSDFAAGDARLYLLTESGGPLTFGNNAITNANSDGVLTISSENDIYFNLDSDNDSTVLGQFTVQDSGVAIMRLTFSGTLQLLAKDANVQQELMMVQPDPTGRSYMAFYNSGDANDKAWGLGRAADGRFVFIYKDLSTSLTGGTAFEYLVIDRNANLGMRGAAAGTSATNTLVIPSGVAPASAPVDVVQLTAYDFAAGDARLNLLSELGSPITFGNNAISNPNGDGTFLVASEKNVIVDIDSDNDGTDGTFIVRANATTAAMTLTEAGALTIPGALTASNLSGSMTGTNTGDQVMTGGTGITATPTGTNYSLAVNQAFSPTWTGAQTFTPSGTNGVVFNTDANSTFTVTGTGSINLSPGGSGVTSPIVMDAQNATNPRITATAAAGSFVLGSNGWVFVNIDADNDSGASGFLINHDQNGNIQAGALFKVLETGNTFIGANPAAGTSATNNLILSNGIAGSTAPADQVALWATPYAASDSRLYIRSELGSPLIIGNNAITHANTDGTLLMTSEKHVTVDIDSDNDGTDGLFTVRANGSTVATTISEVGDITATNHITAGVAGNLRFTPNGTAVKYLLINGANSTYTGQMTIQAGGGSSAFGGGVVLYGHAHATSPGDVVAGISNGSGGRFRVSTSGIDSGGVSVYAVDALGNTWIGGSGTAPTSATKNLLLMNGVAPASQPADQVSIYANDFAAGDSRLHIRTEVGSASSIGNNELNLGVVTSLPTCDSTRPGFVKVYRKGTAGTEQTSMCICQELAGVYAWAPMPSTGDCT